MVKNKVSRTWACILSFVILLLIILIFLQRVHYRKMCWEMQYRGDSLEYLQDVREDKQLTYYGLSYDSINKMLPTPEQDTIWIFTGKLKALEQYAWQCREILSNHKKTDSDTVAMRYVYWKLPYNTLPNLYIGFVKDVNDVWRAQKCVQWSETIKLD